MIYSGEITGKMFLDLGFLTKQTLAGFKITLARKQ